MGTVLSVNIAQPREILLRGKPVTTGIWKLPAEGRVWLREHSLDGDLQADLQVHGGAEMAAYAYAREDAAWWEEQLGRPLGPGTFGENLTLGGVDIATARVGERWRVGNAVVEVTKPRSPCWKLGVKMGDSGFPRRFRAAQRTGAYLAVVEEGDLGAGDPVELLSRPDHPTTIGILAYLYEHDLHLAALVREAATLPLPRHAWLDILRGGGIPQEHWAAWASDEAGEAHKAERAGEAPAPDGL